MHDSILGQNVHFVQDVEIRDCSEMVLDTCLNTCECDAIVTNV